MEYNVIIIIVVVIITAILLSLYSKQHSRIFSLLYSPLSFELRTVHMKTSKYETVSTSASCERSFSALRHIKTKLRRGFETLHPIPRLANLALLAIERERTLWLSSDKVVDAFSHTHKNGRMALI